MLDDKSRSFVVDSHLLRRGWPTYAGAGAALCSICQSNISTNGHIVGRPFPLLFGSTRKLCFSLPSIYRNESGQSGMVAHPGDYRWTSYRANAQGELSGFISPHAVYSELGSGTAQRAEAYRYMFKGRLSSGLIEKIRSSTNGNYVLGDQKFASEIAEILGKGVSPGASGRPKSVS